VMIEALALLINLLPFGELSNQILGSSVLQLIESSLEGFKISFGKLSQLIASE
jgi:hypothetical protein